MSYSSLGVAATATASTPAASGAGWGGAVSSIAQSAGTFADIAAGGPQKRERESRNNLEIARLQASGAAGSAATQLAIAQLQADNERLARSDVAKTQGKTVQMVMLGVGALAVLGIGAAVVLKK